MSNRNFLCKPKSFGLMLKDRKFYIKNVMFGAILLVLGTAMVFATAISAPIPAAAARPPVDQGCNLEAFGEEGPVIVTEGMYHESINDNAENYGCHGQSGSQPISGGARVVKDEDCTSVATPSGNANSVCNTKQ
jgi:hypothetical protein